MDKIEEMKGRKVTINLVAANVFSAAEVEREDILRDARNQISTIAIAICERLLRGELADKEKQTKLAERLLDELENNNTGN